jgi:iron complex transport system substrate-binding protein
MPALRLLPVVALLLLAACAPAPAREHDGTALVDDFGDTLALPAPPQRIVSLNPTTTEILFALGAGSRVVGRTKWDLWPDSARLVPETGDGIRPNVEAVLARRPDLVVLYASADNRPAAERFRSAGIATWAVKVDSIAEFARTVELLGRIIGDTARARVTRDTVLQALDSVRTATRGRTPITVVWHVWDEPLIVIGGGSYLNELVEIAGGRNVYGETAEPSPQLSMEDLLRRSPDAVLVGPVGAARLREDAAWRALPAVREGRVLVVDTVLVGRPSVRLGEAARSLARLLHPGAP